MGFSRQEHWSVLPFPSPGELSNTGIEPASLMYPALAGSFFTTSTTWEAKWWHRWKQPLLITLKMFTDLSYLFKKISSLGFKNSCDSNFFFLPKFIRDSYLVVFKNNQCKVLCKKCLLERFNLSTSSKENTWVAQVSADSQ